MSAYLVFNYAVTDAEGYGAYPGAAFATMAPFPTKATPSSQ